MKNTLKTIADFLSVPRAAKAELWRDKQGVPAHDPGIDATLDAGADWLRHAQAKSATADGGVSRNLSLLRGWMPSYPETTGYIVPTMLEYARLRDNNEARQSAVRMLDWFVEIQLEGGGFQGGRIDQTPVVPVTFNTGQILLGLAAGAELDERYMRAMNSAARWLANTQDDDGCWRKHATPFAKPGEKAYETHVAWGLFEAHRVAPDEGYGEAGLKNVHWALTCQTDNGWVAHCCLNDAAKPLTHTLGYFLRGVVEAHRLFGTDDLLQAALKTANGLLSTQLEDGSMPGRLHQDWRAGVSWVCLTGVVQIAHSWLYLYQVTGDEKFRDAGFAANRYVRRTIRVDGPDDTRGAVKGSFPVNGEYGKYEYLNWAVKFAMDSNMLEQNVRAAGQSAAAAA